MLCEVLSSNRVNNVDTVNEKELSICIFLHMASFQIFSDHMWIQRGFDDSFFFDFLLYFFLLSWKEKRKGQMKRITSRKKNALVCLSFQIIPGIFF